MNKQRSVILILLVIVILALNHKAAGQSGNFIINYADAVVYVNVSDSSALETLFADVMPRFVVEYANSMKYYSVIPIPEPFQNYLENINDRFIIQYANANHYYQLNYPINLIGDISPPSIQNLTLSSDWVVTWDTDEFATGELAWGEQPGIYTHTISNTQYTKSHEFQMFDLTPGYTYYYKVQSEDRSHNLGESQENSFTLEIAISGLTANNNGPTLLGEQTTLTASIIDGTNVTYTWYFGDGTTGSGQIVSHIYPYVHNYTAQVVATNSVSTSFAETTVTIFKPEVSYKLFIPITLR